MNDMHDIGLLAVEKHLLDTERYKEWEGFRRSWHCRKIQKFRFSHNAYLLVFGSE